MRGEARAEQVEAGLPNVYGVPPDPPHPAFAVTLSSKPAFL